MLFGYRCAVLPPLLLVLLLELLLFVGPSPVAEAEEADAPIATGARVTLSLEQYESLRTAQEHPSLTVVDTLRLEGSFGERSLYATFTGHAIGAMPSQQVIGASSETQFHGCVGQAILARAHDGSFTLTPLGPSFSLRCQVVPKGTDRLEVTPSIATLWVESAISDGELVTLERDGVRSFSVVRLFGDATETVRPTASARYRLSLYPEETRFLYRLEVHNPNRSHQPFDLELSQDEQVQQIDARASYEVEGTRYRFNVPPGYCLLQLSGTHSGTSFTPPITTSVQYLLLESHPLLSVEVSREFKRISVGEVGVPSRFLGAQAFLLSSGEKVTWTATRLEALRAASYSVKRVEHTFFLSADGGALGESKLELNNQGASDLTLPMRAEPSYVSIQAMPQLVTRNAKGALYLPISPGEQSVLVQHRQGLERSWGHISGILWLPELATPVTTTCLTLRHASGLTPVYEAFGSETHFWTPRLSLVVLLAVMTLWLERLLAGLRLPLARRLMLASVGGLGSMGSSTLLIVLVAVAVVMTGIWLVGQGRKGLWSLQKAVALGVILGFMVLLYGLTLPQAEYSQWQSPGPEMVTIEDRFAKVIVPREPGQTASTEKASLEPPDYRGVPASFVLPRGAVRDTFCEEMIATDGPMAVRVVALTLGAVNGLKALLTGLGLGLLVWQRKGLLLGLRTWLADLKRPADAAKIESVSGGDDGA